MKRYPHFDRLYSLDYVIKYVTDARSVSRHSFFPFLKYEKRWTKFAARSVASDPKIRPIMYAARMDSYIYQQYRIILSALYEKELITNGLTDAVLAYRKTGLSNVDMAYNVFKFINNQDRCIAIALDLKDFFGSISHYTILQKWCSLMNVRSLPRDHYAVFKTITRHSWVDRDDAFISLGYAQRIAHPKTGLASIKHLKRRDSIPKQLCPPSVFRKLIVGGGLVQTNTNSYGIPQGSPISDLIANMSLIDFDVQCNRIAESYNGIYRRYSDDILLVIDADVLEAAWVEHFIRTNVSSFGAQLSIQQRKSNIVYYDKSLPSRFVNIFGRSSKHGLEYLGFRFDGRKSYIRNATLSNLHRKIARSGKRYAFRMVLNNKTKNLTEIIRASDIYVFLSRYLRVRDFDPSTSKDGWTFWSYLTKSELGMKEFGGRIKAQLRNVKANALQRNTMYIAKSYRRIVLKPSKKYP